MANEKGAPLVWTGLIAASLFVAILYGVVFSSVYRQPIDAAAGVVLFLLGFLTALAGYGLFRLASRST